MSDVDMQNEWLAFGNKLLHVADGIFKQANFADEDKNLSDPKVIALALMCRTVNNYAALRLLIENDFIVEARVMARCCYENFFWIGGLTGKGAEFVKQLIEDDAASKLKRGNELLQWAKKQTDQLDFEGPLQSFLDNLKKENPKPGTISHRAAADAGGIGDAYVFYRVLSTDAAHPSATSLSRHLDYPDEPGADITFRAMPLVEGEEVDETLELAGGALLGVCIGTDKLVGGTPAGKGLSALSDEFKALSNRNKELRQKNRADSNGERPG